MWKVAMCSTELVLSSKASNDERQKLVEIGSS